MYLETSFFSECCTIRTGEIARGRRAVSLKWWQTDARLGYLLPEIVTPDLMFLGDSP